MLVFSLSGCTGVLNQNPYGIPHHAESGGQTKAELEEKLNNIPGLTLVELRTSPPNIKGYTGYNVSLELSNDYHINDPVALLDYITLSVWSVRDAWMPNATIMINLVGGCDEPINLRQVAVDAGWMLSSPPTQKENDAICDEYNKNGWSSVSIVVDETRLEDGVFNKERLGDWPGEVPALPENMVIPKNN